MLDHDSVLLQLMHFVGFHGKTPNDFKDLMKHKIFDDP